MNLNSQKSDILQIIGKFNYRDLLIFLIPFIIFSIYLNVYDPGILTLDSFSQLHQIATGEFTTHHPFFHTFIEMLCLKVFGSTLSIAVLQMLIFSSMWTVICKYHRDDNNDSNVFFLQSIITLIICLIPINAVYSITLWKDVLFSYFLMFLCFLIKVLIDKKGEVGFKYVILLALTMAFVSQLRHNGIYLIIPTLIILSLYLFKRKHSSKNMYFFLPALTIMFILVIAALNVAYDVENAQDDPIFTKTAHMLADYDLHLNLTDADKDKIHKMIPENKIKKSYKIYYSDPIRWNANEQVFDENSGSYIGMALSYSLQNPMRFLFYIFKSADIVWDITRDNDWNGAVYYINGNGSNIVNAKNQYFKSINSTPKENYEDLTDINHGSAKYKSLNSFVNAARENLILDTMFNSPALYMYLAIILLVFMQVMFKTKEMYLVYLPNLFNIIIVFLSIPVQDNRYLYANQLVFYLLAIILISFMLNPKKSVTTSQSWGFSKKIRTEENNVLNEDYKFEDLYMMEDTEIEELPTEEISPHSEETTEELSDDMEDDLIVEILKEMEVEKKNK